MVSSGTVRYPTFGTAGQAGGQPYGEPTYTTTSTIPPAPPAPAYDTNPPGYVSPSKPIQWGKMLKGAAVIVGAVVAVVAAVALVNFGAGFVFGMPGANEVMATAYNFFGGLADSVSTTVVPWLTDLGNSITGLIKSGASWVGTQIGVGSGAQLSASAMEGIKSTAGVVTAGAVGAVAVTKVIPALTDMTSAAAPTGTVIDPTAAQAQTVLAAKSNMLASTAPFTGAHAMHDLTHMAQHTAEHTERPSFAARFSQKLGFTSHADAVRANQPAREPITPRMDASYAAQLEADRARLEESLGQKII